MSGSEGMPDAYDRRLESLKGLPDVVSTRPTTIRDTPLLAVGGSVTYIVQTFRQDKRGDTIFLEVASMSGMVRLALPAKVAAALARQRDSLSKQVRSKVGKRLAAERKDRGEVPFLRKSA